MKRNPQILLSPRQTQRDYLRSYSTSEVYRMCERGELRAFFEQRGNRRKWSIPVSAILEFQQNLISNCEQQLASQRGVRPAIVSTANPIQSGRRVISFPKEVLK